MSITVVFDPPLPSDNPAVFNQKAFTLLGNLNAWSTQANALATEVNQDEAALNAAVNAAATSALNAATSATNAQNSANAASASATAAAASFDAFDDRYLGAKASDPTTDNDGNALQVGALCWNTNANEMRVWNGSSWQAAAGSLVGNADTATKLQTARTITIGNTGKSFDGSTDVAWSLAEIGAAAATHTHTVSQISDSTTVGRSVLTAVDAAAARAAIGAGTGNGDVTLTGTQTLSNKTLTAPESTGAIYDNGSVRSNIVDVASGTNFDLSLGNYFIRTVNGNVTFTVSNAPASRAYAFTVEITHTTGTITWFSGVVWPGGVAPVLTTNRTHLFTFVTDNGGTIWRAVANVNYTS